MATRNDFRFNRQGYDIDGYDYEGFNWKGFDKFGLDEDGLDEDGNGKENLTERIRVIKEIQRLQDMIERSKRKAKRKRA